MIKNIGDFKDFSDNTIKSVFEVDDKKIIEISILFNKDDRDVLCVPTHHFCNLGCKMCHLTNKGLNKTMQKIEIDDLLYAIKDILSKYKRDKDKLLISFMGVGEPTLNFELIENLFKKENELKEFGYKNIGYSLATMMPNNNLEYITKRVDELSMPLKIHFSLHTPIDKDRMILIPSSRVSVVEALNMLENYRNVVLKNEEIISNYKTMHDIIDPIEIHYTLINGINDSDIELNKLIELLSKYNIQIKFIRFNPINDLTISPNEEKWINEIHKIVPSLRIKSYSPPGKEVGSSCGEFTKHYYHYEIETEKEKEDFLKWKLTHKIR